MNTKPYLPVAFAVTGILAAAGCTWVDAKPGSSKVTLVMPEHVTQCRPLGMTTSQVKDKVGSYHRDEETVTEELLTLAKNSAVDLGGDTLVADGGPVDGSQKFTIYKCQ
jgi:hypothetical protein